MSRSPGRRRPLDPDALRIATLVGNRRQRIALASFVSAVASTIWIGQAFVLATAVGDLMGAGGPPPDLLRSAGLFVVLALLRVALEAGATVMLANAAEATQLDVRSRLLKAASAASPFDAGRPHSGAIAAIIAQHVEALAPYLQRYQ